MAKIEPDLTGPATCSEEGAPEAPALPKGTVVDRYIISDLIGRGGMGVVYRAFDPDLNRPVALKLLNKEDVETADALTVLLVPVVAADDSDEGRKTLESWLVDGLDPTWPLGLTIEGWTTYTPEQAIACKGPGEE